MAQTVQSETGKQKKAFSAGFVLKAKSKTPKEPPAAAEASVLQRAIEVIGDRAEAMRWMGTPVRALNYSTPISLLARQEGRKAVLAALEKLAYGIV